jgi:hypothetical protein
MNTYNFVSRKVQFPIWKIKTYALNAFRTLKMILKNNILKMLMDLYLLCKGFILTYY